MINKTLHEAIKAVLFEEDAPLSAEEIARKINLKGLYQRRDGDDVPTNQILARAKKYKDLFFVQEETISLKHDHTFNTRLEIFKKHLKEELNTSKPQEKIDLMNQFLTFQIEEWLKKVGEDNSENDLKNFLEEPSSYYGNLNSNYLNTSLKEHFFLTENVLNWAFNEKKDFSPTLPLEIGRIIAGLNIYKASNKIFLCSNLVWNYLLPVVSDSSLEFKFEGLEFCENPRLASINEKIAAFLELRPNKRGRLENQEPIGILVYKGFKKTGTGIPEEYSFLINENIPSKPRLNKLVLIVPQSSLTSTTPAYVDARKKLLEKEALKAVFTIPQFGQSSISYSFLLFDFTETPRKILFADFLNNHSSWNTSKITEIINERRQISDVSKEVLIEEINSQYQLYPKKYVIDPFDFPIESNWKVFTLKDIVRSWRRGVSKRNLSSLYAGGEIKFLRTSDLNLKGVNFIDTDKVLGIDHDELRYPVKELISGGIVISSVGKNLKATLLPYDDKFLLDDNLLWLKPDENKVIPEFLVHELKKEYVQKQVNYFSSGLGLPRLKKEDILNLRIQLPERAEQEEKLRKEIGKLAIDPSSIYKIQIEDLKREKEDFIKILKHTLKQRVGSLSSDFGTLSSFLEDKIKNGQNLSHEDITVPQFPSDKPEDLEAFKLKNLLYRMENALSLSHEILEKAEDLLKMKFLEKEEIDIKRLVKSLISNKPHLKYKIAGSNIKVFADKSLLTIMFNNFFENAEKHGKMETLEGEGVIAIDLLNSNDEVIIEIRNNGKEMAPDFTIQDFLSYGNSEDKSSGTGFGGYLIGQILKKHNGRVCLIDPEELTLYNVGFRVYIPKN